MGAVFAKRSELIVVFACPVFPYLTSLRFPLVLWAHKNCYFLSRALSNLSRIYPKWWSDWWAGQLHHLPLHLHTCDLRAARARELTCDWTSAAVPGYSHVATTVTCEPPLLLTPQSFNNNNDPLNWSAAAPDNRDVAIRVHCELTSEQPPLHLATVM